MQVPQGVTAFLQGCFSSCGCRLRRAGMIYSSASVITLSKTSQRDLQRNLEDAKGSVWPRASMSAHCELSKSLPTFLPSCAFKSNKWTKWLRCSHQSLENARPVFSFWKSQSLGRQAPAIKGGGRCYRLETVESERVLPTGNGSQMVRSWGKRAGSYLEEPVPEPVFFRKWPWVSPFLARTLLCTSLIYFNAAITRNSDGRKCILASLFSFLRHVSISI